MATAFRAAALRLLVVTAFFAATLVVAAFFAASFRLLVFQAFFAAADRSAMLRSTAVVCAI